MSAIPILPYLALKSARTYSGHLICLPPFPPAGPTMDRFETSDVVIRDTLQAIEKLKYRPLHSLIHYSKQIYHLHDSLESIRTALDFYLNSNWSSERHHLHSSSAGLPSCTPFIIPGSLQTPVILTKYLPTEDTMSDGEAMSEETCPDMSGENPGPSRDDKAAEFLEQVESAFNSGLEFIQPFYENILQFGPGHEKWGTLNSRSQHLQLIITLQRKRPTRQVVVSDRILLIGAVMSLAKDFREFERTHGWVPKQDRLIEPILKDEDPNTQKHPKHGQNFRAIHGVGELGRDGLDQGLRLGIKLYVVDAISQSLNLGHSLTLIVGFEYVKFNRLKFEAFSSFAKLIRGHQHIYNTLAQLSKSFDAWWMSFHELYHECNSTYDIQRRTQATPNPGKEIAYRSSNNKSSQSSQVSPASGSEQSGVASSVPSYIVAGDLNHQSSPTPHTATTQMVPGFSSPSELAPILASPDVHGSVSHASGFSQGPTAEMFTWDYTTAPLDQESVAWNVNMYEHFQLANSSGEDDMYSTNLSSQDRYYPIG